MSRPRAVLSWSSGKDSAWTLQMVRETGAFELVGLLTSLNGAVDRVAMHGVRGEVLRAQARAADLPLTEAALPWPCDNATYEACVGAALEQLKVEQGVTHVIFGDLFLEDIRAYREAQVAKVGLEPVFPLFGRDTTELAREMIRGGLEAHLACVDSEQLPPELSGHRFDEALLSALPSGADPCGENGEFHTVVSAGPMFGGALPLMKGEAHDDGRFFYTDFWLTPPARPESS
ncbi:MAG: ATP-binding protein [Pseudomonadota bacterium]